MEVHINKVPISVTLEREETIGEVYDGVVDWLVSGGHRVVGIALDGAEVPLPAATPHPAAWRDRAITEVATLAVTVESVYQRVVDDLETVINYCDLLRRAAVEGTPAQRDAVLHELPHIQRAIERLAPDLARALTAPSNEELAARAGEVAVILRGRQREFLDPPGELLATTTAIGALLPSLEEVSTRLQTGDGRGAMEMVARFSELATRFIRLLGVARAVHQEVGTLVESETSLHEMLTGLPDLLRELETAIGEADAVLIGDLVEYELAPRFQEAVSLLHQTLRAATDGAPA